MSQENVEIVRRAIDALSQGDVNGYVSLCAPDVEWASPVAPIEGVTEGHDGVRAFFKGLAKATRFFRVEVEQIQTVTEDRIVALGVVHVTTTGGVTLNQAFASVYDLTDGKIRAVRVSYDRAEALADLGLTE